MIQDGIKNLKRAAIVVKPRKPFWDWLIRQDPDQELPHYIINDPEIYLIPDFEEVGQMKKWMKKNFDMIFCDQMNHWYTDRKLWASNRTFETFQQWFDLSFHTMIWDTLDSAIDKI
jgi:hypothetical protein